MKLEANAILPEKNSKAKNGNTTNKVRIDGKLSLPMAKTSKSCVNASDVINALKHMISPPFNGGSQHDPRYTYPLPPPGSGWYRLKSFLLLILCVISLSALNV